MPARKRDWIDRLQIYGPAALLVLLGFAVAYQFIKPAPPDELTLAAGARGGAYHAYAERYRELLAREGITVKILDTAGSIENLQLLRTRAADVAFVQGGASVDGDADLTAIGSLYFEPLWLFHRAGLVLDRLPALRGLRVAVGSEGSGTRDLVLQLLADNGIGDENTRLLALDGAAAAAALAAGESDAVFLVAAPTAPVVADLLARPEVTLASLERADAYARRYRFLSTLTLPEGAVDLARNIPPRPVRLLAPTAGLVSGPALHPALVDLLLLAAQRVHGPGGWFETVGQFPSADLSAYPLNAEARRFYDYGPPLLQRYLPFWAASLVDRLKVMLLPLLVLLLPLFKVMPPIYSWRMRARVYRWYRELEEIDSGLADSSEAGAHKEIQARLAALENEVRRVEVPLSFAGQLYHLRQHIDLVRQRLRGP